MQTTKKKSFWLILEFFGKTYATARETWASAKLEVDTPVAPIVPSNYCYVEAKRTVVAITEPGHKTEVETGIKVPLLRNIQMVLKW